MNEGLVELKRRIGRLAYVLMRNFETMPPEGDLDFFVHPNDKADLEEVCVECLGPDWQRWVDIRTVGDDYYPPLLEHMLLEMCDVQNGWKVPIPGAHFLTLYYHGLVHKGDGRYDEQLKHIFWDWMKPPEPKDKGVGYHAPRKD